MPVWKPNYKQPNEKLQLPEQIVAEIELPQLVQKSDDTEENGKLSESTCLLGMKGRDEFNSGNVKGSSKGTLGVAAVVNDTATIASDAVTVFGKCGQNFKGFKHIKGLFYILKKENKILCLENVFLRLMFQVCKKCGHKFLFL